MSYILEYKDEQEYGNVKRLLDKAKKALHEACEMMEEVEGGSENTMSERGMYRDGMYYRRGGRYRDEAEYRNGRYGY